MRHWRHRISIRPDTMVGKPCIAGTRVPVQHILEKLAGGIPVGDIVHDYPRVTREDVYAAVKYANTVVTREWRAGRLLEDEDR